MKVYKGIPVSTGVAIGRAFVLDDKIQHIPKRVVPPKDVPHQQERLGQAIEVSVRELQALRDRLAAELDPEAGKIVEFHIGLLSDAHFVQPIRERIRKERVTAEFAVTEELRAMAEKFLAINSEALRSKVSDLWDLDRRLIRHLVGETRDRLAHLNTEAIVIATELTPSQTATLPRQHVKAFATDLGGQTSHTSIMAKALGIPAVVGLGHALAQISDDDQVIVDAERGLLIVEPDDATLSDYQGRITRQEAHRVALTELATLRATTKDGVEVKLLGNIEFASEADLVIRNGGDGVGLFRTEYLYLTSDHEPSEEEHYQAYKTAVEACQGRILTVRTLDLGSDKYTQSRSEHPERNPALGLRSIRYSLQNLAVFKRQLRAILRASVLGPVRIMFPLVTTITELRQIKLVLSDVMEDLQDERIEYNRKVPVGIMIEAPSAALLATTLAREVDFMSIGTNDLTQYTLAVDRTNERVANLYAPAHPAVLRLMKQVIRAGNRAGVDVSLCGETAGDVDHTMLLLGLGLRSLSMVPSAIPDIKRVVRTVEVKKCREIARKCGAFDSERQIQNYLRDETRKVMAGVPGGRSAS